jgi:DNA-directed RNA polymerase subunit RPC12/RpoP
VKIENAGDLIFFTYFMIDWEKVGQTPSDQKCAECGRSMMKSEPAVDSKGQKYDGYVCHTDKRLIWIKAV